MYFFFKSLLPIKGNDYFQIGLQINFPRRILQLFEALQVNVMLQVEGPMNVYFHQNKLSLNVGCRNLQTRNKIFKTLTKTDNGVM